MSKHVYCSVFFMQQTQKNSGCVRRLELDDKTIIQTDEQPNKQNSAEPGRWRKEQCTIRKQVKADDRLTTIAAGAN